MDYCRNELDPVLRPIVQVLARERPRGAVQIRAAIAKLAQAIACRDGEAAALVEPEAEEAKLSSTRPDDGNVEHVVAIQGMVSALFIVALLPGFSLSADRSHRAAIRSAVSAVMVPKPSSSLKPRLKRRLA